MNKVKLLKVTNILLFLSMVSQALTGIVLFFNIFVTKAEFFEMMDEIHKYNGLVLTVLFLFHLILNWGWVKMQFSKRSVA